MRTTRCYIKTSNETLGFDGARLNRSKPFPLYLREIEKYCFGSNTFHVAVNGEFSKKRCTYALYLGGDRETPSRTQTSRPVDFERSVSNGGNGQVNQAKFVAAFLPPSLVKPSRAGHEGLLEEVAGPLFTVVDHNSAHHVSYILAVKAFRARPTNRPRIIINFDQHSDYGTANQFAGDLMTCQSWGRELVPAAQNRKVRDGVYGTKYIVIGEKKSSNNTFIQIYEDSGKTSLPGALNAAAIPAILDAALAKERQRRGGDLSGVDVYVTVDRDFMRGAMTPYNEKDYLPVPDVGRAMVTRTLKYLGDKFATLVGFDVHGMPGFKTSGWLNDVINEISTAQGEGRQVTQEVKEEFQITASCAALATELTRLQGKHRITAEQLTRHALDEVSSAMGTAEQGSAEFKAAVTLYRKMVATTVGLALKISLDDVKAYYDAVNDYVNLDT